MTDPPTSPAVPETARIKAREDALRRRSAFPVGNLAGMTYYQWLVGQALAAGHDPLTAVTRADEVLMWLAHREYDT